MIRRLPSTAVAAFVFVAVAAYAGPAVAIASSSPAPGPQNISGPGFHVHTDANGRSDVNVCSDQISAGFARCFARARTDSAARSSRPQPSTVPTPGSPTSGMVGDNGGYDPAYLQSAYNAPSATAGGGQTVAIVDAYDDPNAEADLSYYRSFYGLSACTTANGCFRKVDEHGGTTYPSVNTSWSEEIMLDLDMVSAICPNCHILLVEAASNTIADLGTAVNEAVALGANVVSNSYGGTEYSSELQDDASYYTHPGVAVVASSGDSGYGAQFPAVSPHVTAVGGTTLNQSGTTGTRSATETVWSGSGSGCSALESKPSWQHDSGCSRRTEADVAAVADPNTGVWVYLSYPSWGWTIFGGTSAAAPIVGAMYALAGNPTGTSTLMSSTPYSTPTALNDITSGSNGSCSGYLCNAVTGYDGPTGLGTPNGVAAFSATITGGSSGTTSTSTVSPPQSVSATPGNGSASLTWSAVSSTSAVTYNVYRGTTSGGEVLLKSGLTSTGLADNGLTNGTTYYYTVAAVSGGSTSSQSTEVSATPATVPGAPQNLTAKTATKGVNLTWKAPTSNGGSPITGYVVWRSTVKNSESAYVTVSCTTSTCSYADSATTSKTTYYYQVVAVNAIGSSAKSNQVSARAG